MIAYWEAGYNNSNLTRELALQIEAEHPSAPGDSPNPMGNEVTNAGVPYEEIVWAAGSPTNTEMIIHKTMELDKGGGTTEQNSVYAYNAADAQPGGIFGPTPSDTWANDYERNNGVGYLYTMRDPSGAGNPATLDAVLADINRTYGQEG